VLRFSLPICSTDCTFSRSQAEYFIIYMPCCLANDTSGALVSVPNEGCSSYSYHLNAELSDNDGLWECNLCSSPNYYNELPPHTSNGANFGSFGSSSLANIQRSFGFKQFSPNQNVFCSFCLHNQSLVVKLLSQYEPPSVLKADPGIFRPRTLTIQKDAARTASTIMFCLRAQGQPSAA
jgi:Ima1 N-terminal domain